MIKVDQVPLPIPVLGHVPSLMVSLLLSVRAQPTTASPPVPAAHEASASLHLSLAQTETLATALFKIILKFKPLVKVPLSSLLGANSYERDYG